jgi:tRNA threonylcarbamoyladenosine biosynthesis protein TsaB
MLLLAVDTSGRNGSLALVRVTGSDPTSPKRGKMWGTQDLNYPTQAKGRLEWGTRGFEVLELVPLAGRMYSAKLIPELQNALARQNLKKTDIDGYVVASGPGSFTGLRVGLSTVKALAEVLQKPIAAVSVLEGAARLTQRAGKVMVALDAGRKQAFVGDYEFAEDFKVLRANESLVTFDHLFESLKEARSNAFSSDGSLRDAAGAHGVIIAEIPASQADMFAYIGYHRIMAGDTTPAEVLEANYIRASDAELFSLPKLIS